MLHERYGTSGACEMPRSAALASSRWNSSVSVMSSGSVVSAKRFRYMAALVMLPPRSAKAGHMATGATPNPGGRSGSQVERGLGLIDWNGTDRRAVEAGLVQVHLPRLEILEGANLVSFRLQ